MNWYNNLSEDDREYVDILINEAHEHSENWKEDLIRLFNEQIENRKKHFQKHLDLLDSKLKLLIDSEEKINKYI